MSNPQERQYEDLYEAQNDPSPVSGEFTDNSYAKETQPNLRQHMPVQRDNDRFDDPMQPPYSNTDAQLGEDENEVLDRSNVMGGDRLRHAKPQTGNQYSEGPDEDDLPAEAQ